MSLCNYKYYPIYIIKSQYNIMLTYIKLKRKQQFKNKYLYLEYKFIFILIICLFLDIV